MEKRGKTEAIIPVVQLCAVDCLDKVKKRRYSKYIENALCDSSEILLIFPHFVNPLPLMAVYRTCCYEAFSTSTLMISMLIFRAATNDYFIIYSSADFVNKPNEMPILINVLY